MSEKLNLSLTFGGLALGIILWLVSPRSQVAVAIGLALIFGLLSIPIWNLPWVESSFGRRLAALFFLAGFVIALGDYVWPKTETQRPIPDKPAEKTESKLVPEHPKTLHDFYLADCKGEGGFQLRGTRMLTAEDKPLYQIEFMICGDFVTKSMYVAFFLPESDYTFPACKFLPKVYQDVISKEPGHPGGALSGGVVQQRPGEKEDNAADIKPSGRVFVYHETYMLPSRVDELTQLYKKAGLDPQFRGRDYLIMRTSPLYGLPRSDAEVPSQPPVNQRRLEITFDPEASGYVHSYKVPSPSGDAMVKWTLYRVAVESESPSSGTRLRAVDVLQRTTGEIHRLPLRVKDNPEATEQKLHAGHPEFWDVVEKAEGSDWLTLTHTVKALQPFIIQAPCSIKLISSSDEGSSTSKLLVVDLDKENNNEVSLRLDDIV